MLNINVLGITMTSLSKNFSLFEGLDHNSVDFCFFLCIRYTGRKILLTWFNFFTNAIDLRVLSQLFQVSTYFVEQLKMNAISFHTDLTTLMISQNSTIRSSPSGHQTSLHRLCYNGLDHRSPSE